MEPIENVWASNSQKLQERLHPNRTQLVEANLSNLTAWYHQMPKDLSGNIDTSFTKKIESLKSSKGGYPISQKTPGCNMSYIPPWVASGSGGGHYPPHMLPPQQPTSSSAHSPQSTLGSSSPLGSPHMYQSLSPVNKSQSQHNAMLTQSNHSPKSVPSSMGGAPPPPGSPAPSTSSITSTSVSQAAAAAAAATAAAVAAAVAASNSSGGSSSSPPTGNHAVIGTAYDPQGYHRPVSPSKSHSIKAEIPGLHNLPELALGLAGPSAFDPKGHRKYVRSRSPGKYPAPEQLSTPVMYSYQGRGRPRKHFTHSTGLPTMVPVTHPSAASPEDPEDEENKPFKCNVCTKGFKLKGGLQQHERTHSTDRPYICPDCGKLFRQPTHLQQHMRIHTGEKPYDCTFCDKSFRQRTILNQHLRIHTGEKPYVCMECGKQFRQKAILDQHYRTHLGEKPFACPHPSCRKHFREMASLISHMKCHKDVPDPKIVLQQAKRLIKEEKLDEYGNHENNGIGGGVEVLRSSGGLEVLRSSGSNNGGVEVLTIPHPLGISSNHEGLTNRDPTTRFHNNEEHRSSGGGVHNPRSFPSPSASNANQRSPHSLHGQQQQQQQQQQQLQQQQQQQQQQGTTNNNTGSSNNNPDPPHPHPHPPLTTHHHSIPAGMMAAAAAAATPQMAMANLIPYPHSIFPAASYMMTQDPRPYHQIATVGALTPGGAGSAPQSSPLQARPQ